MAEDNGARRCKVVIIIFKAFWNGKRKLVETSLLDAFTISGLKNIPGDEIGSLTTEIRRSAKNDNNPFRLVYKLSQAPALGTSL